MITTVTQKIDMITDVNVNYSPSDKAIAHYKIKWYGCSNDEQTWGHASDIMSTVQLRLFWKVLRATTHLSNNESVACDYLLIMHELQQERVRFFIDEQIAYCSDWKPHFHHLISCFVPRGNFKSFGWVLRRFYTQVNSSSWSAYPHVEIENSADLDLPFTWKNFANRFIHPKERNLPLKLLQESNSLIVEASAFQYLLQWKKNIEEHDINANVDEDIPGFEDLSGEEKRQMISYCKCFQDCSVVKGTSLRLVRNPHQHTWELRVVSNPIIKKSNIIPLTGVVCDPQQADECFSSFGEMFAFTSFVSLPNGICLDRRERFGFDKYISHSCDPNCHINVIRSEGVGWPLVFVAASRKIEVDEPLTLDYYRMFEYPNIPLEIRWTCHCDWIDPKYFIDHVFCTCFSPNCRKLLYMEELPHFLNHSRLSKNERLRLKLTPFFGLELHTVFE